MSPYHFHRVFKTITGVTPKAYAAETRARRAADKLRHACEAVGALDRYEAGQIDPGLFPGHACEVRLDIEKQRGYPDRSVIVDYRAAASESVTPLRRAG